MVDVAGSDKHTSLARNDVIRFYSTDKEGTPLHMLTTNVRLVWMWLSATNALAYNSMVGLGSKQT